MYSSYYNYPINNYSTYSSSDGDRLIAGGFVGPFLLGGLTGALLSPGFYRPYPIYPPFYPPFYYRRFPRFYY